MKRPIIIILSVFAVFILLGTAALNLARLGFGFGGAPAAPATEAPAMEAPAAFEPAFDSAGADLSREAVLNSTGQVAQERLVIENADLSIVVKDPKARMKEISDMAREMGGFVVSSNLYQSFTQTGLEVPEASVVIRVPSKRLDEALEKIKAGVVDIQYENRSGQDVTAQYVDLKSQLTAMQAAEKKLLEILDKATRAEDVLAIYLQVQSVQSQIEVLKGQIKYLEESALLSAISVRLVAEEGTQPIEVGPWKPQGAARDAVQDLILFFQNFVDFLIRFVLFSLPSLILIAIPLFLAYLGGRAVYRRARKSDVKVEEKGEEKK